MQSIDLSRYEYCPPLVRIYVAFRKSAYQFLVSGESLKASVLRQAAPYIPVTTTFVNLFGQSECQCICIHQVNDVQHASFVSSLIPTGRALPGCTVALFDENDKAITTVDTVGELFVTGEAKYSKS